MVMQIYVVIVQVDVGGWDSLSTMQVKVLLVSGQVSLSDHLNIFFHCKFKMYKI